MASYCSISTFCWEPIRFHFSCYEIGLKSWEFEVWKWEKEIYIYFIIANIRDDNDSEPSLKQLVDTMLSVARIVNWIFNRQKVAFRLNVCNHSIM